MIKKHLKVLMITSLIILLPVIFGVVIWDKLPDKIPSHWNFAGEIDSYSSKAFSVFAIPLMMLGFQWICVLGTGADPKNKNHSDKMVHLLLWIIPVISTVMHIVVYAAALGKAVRVEIVMPVLIGLVLTIVGNYLPKCKQNYTIGIKIPWTLSSEKNWNKTHRFAGWLWTFCGIALMLTGILGIFWIFLGVVLLMVLSPVIYSYALHRKGI